MRSRPSTCGAIPPARRSPRPRSSSRSPRPRPRRSRSGTCRRRSSRRKQRSSVRGVSRRRRVLIVITLAEVGGAQTYVASLLPELTKRYDVTVAAWGPGPLVDATIAAGARFVPLRNVRRELGWRDALGLVELVQLFRRERPDLVHLNSSKVGVLGRI